MRKQFKPYVYYKRPPAPPPTSPQPSRPRSRLRILLPAVFITLGSVIMANVAWPILQYQFFVSPNIRKTQVVSPIPTSELGSRALALPTPPQAHAADQPEAQLLGAVSDLSHPKNWFPNAEYQHSHEIVAYTLDIPKVDIKKAQVIIGGEELDKSLIQYPGTARPGELGSPVIFGHSILRQFYNPSLENKDRYLSIFSKIMLLENSDRIYITYDGIRYTYEVIEKVEVEPDDLFILEQRYSNRTLKLITCVPEGTYLRRGVVIAQLVNLNYQDSDATL